jgi:hypothetical protein
VCVVEVELQNCVAKFGRKRAGVVTRKVYVSFGNEVDKIEIR